MDAEKEVNNVMQELRTGSGKNLYGALIMLRTTLIKSRQALDHLVRDGCVHLLVQLLEDRVRHVSKTKTIDIVMSILANMCMEEQAREKVVNCDGVSVIARMTLAAEVSSVRNRGVRALVNLAQDPDNCKTIMELEIPAFVAEQLLLTDDNECRITYCRALRLFGQSLAGLKRLTEGTLAIQATAHLLKVAEPKLALKALRTLSEFSALSCCSVFASQVLAADILKELLTYIDDENNDSAYFSYCTTLRLCEHEKMRPALGSAGIVSLLVRLMSSQRVFINTVSILNALCLFTKEAVNRAKILEAGGLDIFILALRGDANGDLAKGQFAVLYDRLLSSLINFLYNDDCLARLLELDMVKLLVKHLRRCSEFEVGDDDLRGEMADLAVALVKDMDGGGIVPPREERGFASVVIEEADVPTVSARGLCDQRPGALGENDPEISGEENCDSFKASGAQRSFNALNMEDLNETIDTEGAGTSCNDDGIVKDLEEDPLIIDKDITTENVLDMTGDEGAPEKDSSADEMSPVHELSPPGSSATSKHVFSIHSPTYLAETSWRLEDYTTGVTCKTFTPALGQDATQPLPHSSVASSYPSFLPDDSQISAPYSPLSANISYYSPARSSPSYNQSLSPWSSPPPSSPGSGSDQTSPRLEWSISGSERPTSPASPPAAYSPFQAVSHTNSGSQGNLSAIQQAYSPLSHQISGSPTQDFISPSPATSYQVSSQSTHMDTPPYLTTSSQERLSEQIASELMSARSAVLGKAMRFAIVPLSQDSDQVENPVYSASEDEEEEEEEEEADVNGKVIEKGSTAGVQSSQPSVGVNASNSSMICETRQNSERDRSSFGETEVEMAINADTSCNSDERRKSHKHSLLQPTDRPGVGGLKRRRLTEDDEDSIDTTGEESTSQHIEGLRNEDQQCHINLPAPSDSQMEMDKDLDTDTIDLHSKLALSSVVENTITPSGVSSMRSQCAAPNCSKSPSTSSCGTRESPAMPSFLRKEKVSMRSSPASSAFKASPLSSMSPFSKYGASPLYSDSPYRSPYPESVDSPKPEIVVNENISGCGSKHKVSTSYRRSVSTHNRERNPRNKNDRVRQCVQPSEMTNASTGGHVLAASETLPSEAPPSETPPSETITDRLQQENDNTNNERVRKILKTSESNILILLSRISLKTNPTQHMVNPLVISSLLGYLSYAPHPIQRCCRILQRLCANPLCFERLILVQTPALLVKYFVLEKDGSLPDALFQERWVDKFGTAQRRRLAIADYIGNSGVSEASSSQASDFGKMMDFEFGWDAYSRIQSPQAAGSIFRIRPSPSMDSQEARDSAESLSEVYESGYLRSETKIRIGLGLIRSLGSVASSRYEEGELKHLLIRGSLQDQMACLVSLMFMPIGQDTFSRHQLLKKYRLWDTAVPCLFLTDTPKAREIVIIALSFLMHVEEPPKLLGTRPLMLACPDIQEDRSIKRSSQQKHSQIRVEAKQHWSFLSERRNFDGTVRRICDKGIPSTPNHRILIARVKSLKDLCNNSVLNPALIKTSLKQVCTDKLVDCKIDKQQQCPYENMAAIFNVCLVIQDNPPLRFHANRELLMRKSAVFAAMLGGMYAEAQKSEIEISNVSAKGLEFVIHHLHGCCEGCKVIDSVLEFGSCKSRGKTTASADAMPGFPLNTSSAALNVDTEVSSDGTGTKIALKVSAESDTNSQQIADVLDTKCSHSSHLPSHLDVVVSGVREEGISTLTPTCPSLMAELTQSEESLMEENGEPSDKAGSSKNISQSPTCKHSELKRKDQPSQSTSKETAESEGGSITTRAAAALKELEEFVNFCSDILIVADRFLVGTVVTFVSGALSYLGLHPHTCTAIFDLACFYKLNSLAVDCARESLMSNMLPSEVATLYQDLDASGHREPAMLALATLLHSILSKHA